MEGRYRITSKITFKLVSKLIESVKQLPYCVIYTFFWMCCFWQGRGLSWGEPC